MADFAEQLAAALGRYRVPRRRNTRRTSILVGLIALLSVAGFVATRGTPDAPQVPQPLTGDPFHAGAVWGGQYHFLPPTENDGQVTLSITERTGADFVGEYATIDSSAGLWDRHGVWLPFGGCENDIRFWVAGAERYS